jgi:hypothetical protein
MRWVAFPKRESEVRDARPANACCVVQRVMMRNNQVLMQWNKERGRTMSRSMAAARPARAFRVHALLLTLSLSLIIISPTKSPLRRPLRHMLFVDIDF